MSSEPIKSRIRTIPDHPKPGIQFRDITTLLQDPVGLHLAVQQLAGAFKAASFAQRAQVSRSEPKASEDHWVGERSPSGVDKVAGIEARGFILGGAVAVELEAGFVAVRKAGKLPHTTIGVDYDLEYGTDRVEIHTDAIHRGERVLVIDDLIATGGTALASVELIEQAGGEVVGCGFIIDLPDLGGAARLRGRGLRVHALCAFEGG